MVLTLTDSKSAYEGTIIAPKDIRKKLLPFIKSEQEPKLLLLSSVSAKIVVKQNDFQPLLSYEDCDMISPERVSSLSKKPQSYEREKQPNIH